MAQLKPGKLELPKLETGPVSLVSIRDQARKQLLDAIDSRRGKKALILDPAISGPLGLLDTELTKLLTERGVERLLYLEPGKRLDDPSYNTTEPRLLDVPSVLYLVRPNVANAQAVAAQVKGRAKSGSEPQSFSVFFVPRRTIACERILEDEGVLGDIAIGEYALDMVPYDDDVISLELDTAFYDCVCDGDCTPLYYMASAITRLQAMFGVIPRVQGKGPAAAAVRDMCVRMRRETSALISAAPLGATMGGAQPARIDRLILLDREVDLITPMMTQITFEGLIDEITGIRHGSVPWQQAGKRTGDAGDGHGAGGSRGPVGRTLLNSTDPFYKEFRDLPFHVTIKRLQQYALEAKREYSELGSKDLKELKSFVKGLPKLPMLDRLSDVATPLAERVKEQGFHDKLGKEQAIVEGYEPEDSVAFIEELMYRGADLTEVLRLLVLLSAVSGGLPRRQLDSLRMEVLHTYGHQHLLTLNALEKSGLLKASSGARSQFQAVRKALQLIVPEQDGPAGAAAMDAPTDVSHLYKGYAPLSIRLVEMALRTGWSSTQLDVLSHLLGTQFDILQTVDNNGMPVEKALKPAASSASGAGSSGPPAGSGAGGGVGGGGGGNATSGSLHGLASLSSSSATAGGSPGSGAQQFETVMVAFVGGVTFAEISALRFLSSRPEWPYRFLVLTTKIINGRTLLQPFIDPLALEFAATG